MENSSGFTTEEELRAIASRKEIGKALHTATNASVPFATALRNLLKRKAGKQSFAAFARNRLADRQQSKVQSQEDKAKAQEIANLEHMQSWHGWFDGATVPNPGRRGIGALLKSPDGVIHTVSKDIGYGTNNEAEYEALIACLELAIEHQSSSLIIHGDSQLVICQVSGEWDVNAPGLRPLRNRAANLVKQIRSVKLKWIPRDKNGEADALSKAAIGYVETAKRSGKSKDWGTQTDIAKPLQMSAIALGKLLDQSGLRLAGQPTDEAVRLGIVAVEIGHFGPKVSWHKTKLPSFLRASHLV